MLFSSLTFLFIFLPVVMAVYFLTPDRAKNLVLLCASLVFYAWGEPRYIVLMIFSTVFDYFNGLGIEAVRRRGGTGLWILVLSMCGNLALLGFFKYAGFVVSTAGYVSGADLSFPQIALPIGISFYTFQTMSYTIDVYRKNVEAQHNLIDFAAYVTLFPQLIAGPIVRYSQVSGELVRHRLSTERFGMGAQRFVIGLGKKVIFANRAGAVWDEIQALGSPSAATALAGAVCFTFQIYFDFSGYSDMAIGLGQMLGFTFPENFNYPYMCRSITDFWRRWHMTLGTWFREYVYIPLGGNMHGMAKQLRNILIVWFLTGLWHGAAWTFVCWGLYYGLVLVIEKLWLLRLLDRLPAHFQWLRHVYTLLVIVAGWMIFAAADFGSMAAYMRALAGANGFADAAAGFYLTSYGPMMLVLAAACTDRPAKLWKAAAERLPRGAAAALENIFLLAVFLMSLAFLVGDSYNPFLYFRF